MTNEIIARRIQRKDEKLSLLILVISFLILSFRLWITDFTQWDYPTNYIEAQFSASHLWPWLSGWNPHGFGGFPQGYFTPPLLAWLAGGLSKFLPLGLALHALMTLSLVLLPMSLFLFLEDLGFSVTSTFSSIFLALTTLILLSNSHIVDVSFGGSFSSGHFDGIFALPFVFLYLWAFRRGVRRFYYLIAASLFFAVVLLTNKSAALVLADLSLGLGYWYFVKKNPHKIFDYILHIILVIALSAVWIGPAFMFKNYAGAIRLYPASLLSFTKGVGIPLLLMWVFFFLSNFKMKGAYPQALRSIIVLFFFVMVGYIATSLIPTMSSAPFVPFLYIFGFVVACYYFSEVKNSRPWFHACALIYCLACAYAFFFSFPVYRTIVQLSEVERPYLRGLVDENMRGEMFHIFKAPHQLSSIFASQNYDLLNGPDVRDSLASKYIFGFLREVDPYADSQNAYPIAVNRSALSMHGLLLGVQWILSNDKLAADVLAALPVAQISKPALLITNNPKSRPDVLPHICYHLTNSKITLLTKAPLFVTPADWDQRVDSWWNAPDMNRFPIESRDDVSLTKPSRPEESAQIDAVSSSSYKVTIQASEERWAYIKIPYFPNWKAFQANSLIPVYRAGPNMMAVRTKGSFVLFYARSKFEKICHYISLVAFPLALLWIAFECLFPSNRTLRKNPSA